MPFDLTQDPELRQEKMNSEQAVLGSMLIDDSIIREVLSEIEENDFIYRQNRIIFRCIRALFRTGVPVDAITVRERMVQAGIKGFDHEVMTNYLSQLIEITPTSANWREYMRLTHEQAVVYYLKCYAAQILESRSLDEHRTILASMTQSVDTNRGVKAWDTKQMYENFMFRQDPKNTPELVETGFERLDRGICIRCGKYVVLGAMPGCGKTAFSLNLAYNISQKRKVGFFSFETEREDAADRTISSSAQVDYSDIQHHRISAEDMRLIEGNLHDYVSRNLTVIDAIGYTASKIRAISQIYGFEVVFVDYFQLVKPENMNKQRTEQLSEISQELYNFAKETQTLVFVNTQLTRTPSGEWRKPTIRSAKGSSEIEENADLIMMLYRPNPADDENQDEHRILEIVKNRGGPLGNGYALFFDGAHQTFSFIDEERTSNEIHDFPKKRRSEQIMDLHESGSNLDKHEEYGSDDEFAWLDRLSDDFPE